MLIAQLFITVFPVRLTDRSLGRLADCMAETGAAPEAARLYRQALETYRTTLLGAEQYGEQRAELARKLAALGASSPVDGEPQEDILILGGYPASENEEATVSASEAPPAGTVDGAGNAAAAMAAKIDVVGGTARTLGAAGQHSASAALHAQLLEECRRKLGSAHRHTLDLAVRCGRNTTQGRGQDGGKGGRAHWCHPKSAMPFIYGC